jgi:hypothetical protein
MKEKYYFSFRFTHHSLVPRQPRGSSGAAGTSESEDERDDRRTLSFFRS